MGSSYGVVVASVALSYDPSGGAVLWGQGMNIVSVALSQLPGTSTPNNCWEVVTDQKTKDNESHLFEVSTVSFVPAGSGRVTPPSLVPHVYIEAQGLDVNRRVRVYLTDGAGGGAGGAGGFDVAFSADQLGHLTAATDLVTGYDLTSNGDTLGLGWRPSADTTLSSFTISHKGDVLNVGLTVGYTVLVNGVVKGIVTLPADADGIGSTALAAAVVSGTDLVAVRCTPSATLAASVRTILSSVGTTAGGGGGGGAGAVVRPQDAYATIPGSVHLIVTRTDVESNT